MNSTTLYNTKQNKYVKLDKTMHVNIKHTYTNRGRELYLWAEEDPSKRERERERVLKQEEEKGNVGVAWGFDKRKTKIKRKKSNGRLPLPFAFDLFFHKSIMILLIFLLKLVYLSLSNYPILRSCPFLESVLHVVIYDWMNFRPFLYERIYY